MGRFTRVGLRLKRYTDRSIMQTQTQDLTEITKSATDINAPSMSIGGGGQQIQHLDKPSIDNEEPSYAGPFSEDPQPKENASKNTNDEPTNETTQTEQPKEETNKTQGEYQAELDTINRQIETNIGRIETLNNFINDVSKWDHNTNIIKELGQMRSILGDEVYKELASVFSSLTGKGWADVKSTMIEHTRNVIGNIEKSNAPLTTRKYEIETSSNYDNRPYEDIRADTAYQRAVDDMTKAGLNKFGLTGGINYGSSSSSRNDEEDEKKKKKKRELEEARRRAEEMQRAEEMRKSNDMMKVLGIITGLTGSAGLVGSSVFNGIEKTKQAQIYADTKNVDTVTQSYDRNGELYNQQYKEYIKKRK